MENQSVRHKFCKKCGTPAPIEGDVCPNCGMSLLSVSQPNQEIPDNIHMNGFGQNVPFQSNAFGMYQQVQPTSPPQKPKKKMVLPIVIGAVLLVAVSVFAVLCAAHVICLNHNWIEADCENAKMCSLCDKAEGEPLGHDWSKASCTEDSVCKRCEKTGEAAKGHTEGEWTAKTQATLTSEGVEEKLCTECSKQLDEREVGAKQPGVLGASFNFKDEEFAKWIEEEYPISVSHSDLDMDGFEEGTTAYDLYYDYQYGLMLLTHDPTGNISSIMIYFEDETVSGAICSVFAQEFDSQFSANDSAWGLAYYDYYSDCGMTIINVELDTDFIVTVLSPDEFYNDTYSEA